VGFDQVGQIEGLAAVSNPTAPLGIPEAAVDDGTDIAGTVTAVVESPHLTVDLGRAPALFTTAAQAILVALHADLADADEGRGAVGEQVFRDRIPHHVDGRPVAREHPEEPLHRPLVEQDVGIAVLYRPADEREGAAGDAAGRIKQVVGVGPGARHGSDRSTI
jgi:hypothetical protein